MTKETYTYANTLKEQRHRCGLLQQQVAELLGFKSGDRISHWEKGRNIPSLPNLIKLCVLYRVSPLDIYRDLTDVIEDEIEDKRVGINSSI